MADFDDYYAFRSQMIDRLRLDLIGPSQENEVLTDPPITRYQVGILYPAEGRTVDSDQDSSDGVELRRLSDEDDSDATDVSTSSVRYPSSIGLTFSVDAKRTSTLVVQVGAARYEELDDGSQDQAGPTSDVDASSVVGRRARRRHVNQWMRVPGPLKSLTIDTTRTELDHRDLLADGLTLFSRVRSVDDSSRRSITLMLINTTINGDGGFRDATSWFQPSISVTSGGGDADIFVARPTVEPSIDDDDLLSYRLLYRNVRSLATGHGCAANWNSVEGDPDLATEVHTELLPVFELELADSNPEIPMDRLTYRMLCEGDRSQVLAALEGFCEGYSHWIDLRAVEVGGLETSLRPTAEVHLARCREALERMIGGVEVLGDEDDPLPWDAFRLANRAMLDQRARTVWLEDGCPPGGPDPSADEGWRPFQLAFILLCLRGITDGSSAERDVTDLLWFPTGGGKTEAYLGLLAYLIVLRRLRHGEAGAGVTTIMRYTLRLLTIQQFERAALLICALESMRHSDRRLGSTPIEMGLWVGKGATPNDLDGARAAITKLRRSPELDEGNPLQLQRCPWCGRDLGFQNVFIGRNPRRLIIACKNRDCSFAEGLPVLVVDEDIYARRPALLIATADKFASLPYRDDCRKLFNLDVPRDAPS